MYNSSVRPVTKRLRCSRLLIKGLFMLCDCNCDLHIASNGLRSDWWCRRVGTMGTLALNSIQRISCDTNRNRNHTVWTGIYVSQIITTWTSKLQPLVMSTCRTVTFPSLVATMAGVQPLVSHLSITASFCRRRVHISEFYKMLNSKRWLENITRICVTQEVHTCN